MSRAPRPRLAPADVGCWVLKTASPLEEAAPGWAPGEGARLARCLHPTYRLGLLRAGQPCLLWRSGREAPGVHALGVVLGPPAPDPGGRPRVEVALRRLRSPVPRAALLADPVLAAAEVLRVPAGGNPSYLGPEQFAALRAHLAPGDDVPPRAAAQVP